MREVREVTNLHFYFFSTLTFWLSHERPSKMPVGKVSVSMFFSIREIYVYALLTLSAGGATRLDLPDVVLGYPVEIEGLGYVVWSHS